MNEHALFQEDVSKADYNCDETSEEDESGVLNLVGRKKSEDAHRGTRACPGTAEYPVLADELRAVEQWPGCGEQVADRVDLAVVIALDL